jgi:hypothetical protein
LFKPELLQADGVKPSNIAGVTDIANILRGEALSVNPEAIDVDGAWVKR